MFFPGMSAFAEFNVDSDGEENSLVLYMSSLYKQSLGHRHPERREIIGGADESWVHRNIHKKMIEVCNKYNDIKWLVRGQHRYCIYYALRVLGSICNRSEQCCIDMVNTPDFMSTLVELWRGRRTWFEARVTALTISNMLGTSPSCAIELAKNKHNINIVKLATTQYITCVKSVIKRHMISPNKIAALAYVNDLILSMKGRPGDYNDDLLRNLIFAKARYWMTYNGTILGNLSRSK
eukprot:235316_1